MNGLPGRLALPVALAAVFGLVVINQSVRQGQLSVPITFDDISYFVEAATRLQAAFDGGLFGLIDGWLAYPPHSPFATLTVFLGFLVFGIRDWAPAAFNVLWLAAMLLMLDRLLLRDEPRWVRVSLLLAVLAWPVTSFLVIESRPDIVNGYLLAFGAYLAISRPWLGAPNRHHISVAVLFGLALLCKPSYSVVSIGVFGLTLLVASGIDLLRRDGAFNTRRLLAVNAKTFLVGLALVMPHYLLTWERTFGYIYTTVFGAEKDLWAVNAPEGMTALQFHLTWYLNGPGGWALMGDWFFLTAAIVVVACATDAVRNREALARTAGLLLVGVVVWIVISSSATKSLFLGAAVACMAQLLFVHGCVRVLAPLRTVPVRPAYVAATATTVFVLTSASLFNWHWYHRQSGQLAVESPTIVERRHDLVADVSRLVAPDAEAEALVYFPVITAYLNPGTLTFDLLKREMSLARAVDNHRSGDLDAHRKALESATHVVLFAGNDPDVLGWLPSVGVLAPIAELLDASADFRLVGNLEAPLQGGDIRVYARPKPFEGLRFVENFLPLEGPYPQWSLPRLRWSVGESAMVRVTADMRDAVLEFEGRSPYRDQSVTVASQRGRIGGCDLPLPDTLVKCRLSLGPVTAGQLIELRFRLHDADQRIKRAVLFTRLRVEDAGQTTAPQLALQ